MAWPSRWRRGFPTGDEEDFLGSGAFGLKPAIIFSSSHKVVSFHLNAAYQWNGESLLAGNVQLGQKADMPDQVLYSGGLSVAVAKPLTLVGDLLGRRFLDTPRLQTTTFTALNGTTTLPDIAFKNESFSELFAAAGPAVERQGRAPLRRERALQPHRHRAARQGDPAREPRIQLLMRLLAPLTVALIALVARPGFGESTPSAFATPGARAEEPALRKVLERYVQAIENKDLAAFRSVKPNLSAEEELRAKKAFESVQSQVITMTVLAAEVQRQRSRPQGEPPRHHQPRPS